MTSERDDQLVRALASIRQLRTRLSDVERLRTAPIAVIGLGCRLPGADHPDRFWELLEAGTDLITDTPGDRWDADAIFDPTNAGAGTVTTRWGGFIDDVDRFDAGFFGISPREAELMDPQQRLFLEVAWEAMEDGGQNIDDLAGSATGVFVGVHSLSNDYQLEQVGDLNALTHYSGTGSSHAVISGRLSYLLDLRGPSVAVDTACSSSLVAVHQAVQSLRAGESSTAVVGGVNLLVDPMFTVVASRMGMMSPTGRCHPFDAAGDGYVRSDACVAVVLKRLDDAIADGDPIRAVIRGSAVNQDGRSNGLTAPNGTAQEAVIRAALTDAATSPTEIGLVETHGTGTPLGDPIEIGALSAVYREAEAPTGVCHLGSAKANVGHTEGAAGLVGLLKAILSIEAGAVPPLLHFATLNPRIDLTDTAFAIPTRVEPWGVEGQRVAAVSSFGWSGTNAHVIVAEPPDRTTVPPGSDGSEDGAAPGIGRPAGPPHLLSISARSDEARRELAERWAEHLDAVDEIEVDDLCAAAVQRRSAHPYRLAVTSADRSGLVEALQAAAAGAEHPALHRSVAQPGLVTFVCPGQGSQWDGMARDLLAGDPVFASTIAACAVAMAPHVDWSLTEIIETGRSGDRTLDDIDVVQPVLFAVSVALASVWRAAGVEPDAVVGHSMGEVAAAHLAGVLDLDDAATVICTRSSLLRRIRGRGAMALVDLDEAAAEAALVGLDGSVSVAVVNSRSQTVVAGDTDAIERFLADQENADVFARRVNVDVASHSPQVDQLLGELGQALATITPHPASIPLLSSVTGRFEPGPELGADYWTRNLRQPVRFGDAIDRLVEAGHRHFIELSPHPVLALPVAESLRHNDVEGSTVASVRREDTDGLGPLRGLAHLATTGAEIDWSARYGPRRPAVPLPAYPWQRDAYWLPDTGRGPVGVTSDDLLGWEVPLLEDGTRVWRHRLRRDQSVLVAAGEADGFDLALVIEILVRAAEADRSTPVALEAVRLFRPLTIEDESEVQVVRRPTTDGHRIELSVELAGGPALVASAELGHGPDPVGHPLPVVTDPAEPIEAGSRVDLLRQVVAHLTSRCTSGPTTDGAGPEGRPWRPVGIGRLTVGAGPATRVGSMLAPHGRTDSNRLGAAVAVDGDGGPVVVIEDAILSRTDPTVADAAAWLARPTWRPLDGPNEVMGGAGPRSWLVTSVAPGRPAQVADRLAAQLGDGADRATVLDGDPDDVGPALVDAASDVRGPVGLAVVVASPSRDLAASDQVEAMIDTVDRLRAIVAAVRASRVETRIWLITTDAHAVTEADLAAGALAGMAWGFGRVVAEEAPEVWGGMVDLAPSGGEAHHTDDPATLAAFLAATGPGGSGERELALRDGRFHVTRLVPSETPPVLGHRFPADRAVLITGGFGAIGRNLARWLVEAGVRHLVLAGRTALPDRASWAGLDPGTAVHSRVEIVRQLESLGASVHVPSLDVTDPEVLVGFARTWADEQRPPITSVFHTAAVLGGELLDVLTIDDLRTQIHPKVTGALAIEAAFPELDHLILFSSISGLLPMAGTAAYAAANAALDAIAVRRRAHGRPALSVNWGVWEESNEVLAGERRQGRADGDLGYKDEAALLYAEYGVTGFRTDQGLDILGRLLREPAQPQILFSPVDWVRFASTRGGRTLPLIEGIVDVDADAGASADGDDLAAILAEVPPEQRLARLEEEVRSILGSVLKLPADRIDPRAPMGDLGLDSMMGVELRNRVEGRVGLQLSATVAWNHPTTADLAQYLLGRLGGATDGAPTSDDPAIVTAAPSSTASAIAAEVSDLSDEDALAALIGLDSGGAP